MLLTILTPTYNRAGMLPQLYDSLKKQACKDFEWVIVDDGSTDNTQEVVKAWLLGSDFPIRYFYKENGGKHTALNYAVQKIEAELTFIVDSDDALTIDAVETILRYHRKYENRSNICGYAFLRSYPNGKINGKKFVPDERIASYIDARINSDDTKADKAEVFKTECLREFPFPEYQDEKFLGEDIVWIRMARKYMMVHINKVVYVGSYQVDGLTKNRRFNNIKSPVGCMNRAIEFMQPELKWKYRIKGAIQYIVYGKFAGYTAKFLYSNIKTKLLVSISFLPGILIYNVWKRKSDFIEK